MKSPGKCFLPVNYQARINYVDGYINDENHIRNDMGDQYNNISMGSAYEPTKGSYYVTKVSGRGRPENGRDCLMTLKAGMSSCSWG